MSSYTVLSRVSHGLRQLLWEAFRGDAQIGMNDRTQIVFVNPTAAAQSDSSRLSLWMYRVVENGYVKNAPTRRGNGNGSATYPPLALDLYFLVTPIVGPNQDPHRALILLGKTMQVFYDQAIELLDEPNFNVVEELKISLMSLTLEEQTRIWEALQAPYQLSVCYKVQIAEIDSERTHDRQPVEHREADFADGVH